MLWEILTFSALSFTLLAVVWYALETRKLRQETVKQTELKLRPCIHIQGSKLKNIGHSPALNISIESIKAKSFHVEFLPMNLLEPGEIRKPKYRENEEEYKELHFSFYDSQYFDQDYNITINYKNIENQDYKSVIRVHCKERRIELIETSKV